MYFHILTEVGVARSKMIDDVAVAVVLNTHEVSKASAGTFLSEHMRSWDFMSLARPPRLASNIAAFRDELERITARNKYLLSLSAYRGWPFSHICYRYPFKLISITCS